MQKKLLVVNKECEAKWVNLVQPCGTDTLPIILAEEIRIDTVYKLQCIIAKFIYKDKNYKNLTYAYMVPNRGKLIEVRACVTDSKKGSVYDSSSLSD